MTENKGPSVMKRSWRVGDCLRHQRVKGAGCAWLSKVEGVDSCMRSTQFTGVVLELRCVVPIESIQIRQLINCHIMKTASTI